MMLMWVFLGIFLPHASAGPLWRPLTFPRLHEIIREMTFIPPATYYVQTDSGWKQSHDGGASWVELDLGLLPFPDWVRMENRYVTITRTNPQVIYAGHWGEVYRSADGGANWTTITPDLGGGPELHQLGPLMVSPFHANHLALNYDGPTGTGCLLFSEDGGQHWTCIGGHSASDRFFIHPGTGEAYFRGNDGRHAAIGWVNFLSGQVEPLFFAPEPFGYGFGFSSEDSSRVYFAFRALSHPTQILFQTNQRQELTPIFSTKNLIPDSVAFHAGSWTLFLSVRERESQIAQVMRTEDRGKTWTACGELPARSQLFFISDDDTLYAKSKHQIWQLEFFPQKRLATTWGALKRQ